jgi:hypothetical protein
VYFPPIEVDTMAFITAVNDTVIDTNIVRLRDYDDPIKHGMSLSQKVLFPGDSMVLRSTYPFRIKPNQSIAVNRTTDTVDYTLTSTSGFAKRYTLRLGYADKMKGSLTILPGVIEFYDSSTNDTLELSYQAGKTEDYANFTVIVNPLVEGSYVLQLVKNSAVVWEGAFTDALNANLPYLDAGSYSLVLISDENGDGKWTPGSWWFRRQPEKVYYYRDPIEIKDNWELETRLEPSSNDALPKVPD